MPTGHATAEVLFDAVYADLRRQAQVLMNAERRDHTLQPTALVHEAYLQLIRLQRIEWQGRRHFFAIASGIMRRLLVDHARRRNAARRGGGVRPLSLDEGLGLTTNNPTDVLAVHDALDALEVIDPRMAQIVSLRFFGGLTMPEIAAFLEVSLRTANGEWALARGWLRRQIRVG